MASPVEEERLESEFHDEEEGGPVKSFLEHLEDLRWVLIKCVVGVGILMVVCLIAVNQVLTIITWPLKRADKFRKTPGTELFWVAFQVALYGGIVFAAPYLIYVIGGFVLPALKIKERKYLLRGFAIGSGLFMMGVFFCYFVLMPVALRASYKYSEWLGFTADQW